MTTTIALALEEAAAVLAEGTPVNAQPDVCDDPAIIQDSILAHHMDQKDMNRFAYMYGLKKVVRMLTSRALFYAQIAVRQELSAVKNGLSPEIDTETGEVSGPIAAIDAFNALTAAAEHERQEQAKIFNGEIEGVERDSFRTTASRIAAVRNTLALLVAQSATKKVELCETWKDQVLYDLQRSITISPAEQSKVDLHVALHGGDPEARRNALLANKWRDREFFVKHHLEILDVVEGAEALSDDALLDEFEKLAAPLQWQVAHELYTVYLEAKGKADQRSLYNDDAVTESFVLASAATEVKRRVLAKADEDQRWIDQLSEYQGNLKPFAFVDPTMAKIAAHNAAVEADRKARVEKAVTAQQSVKALIRTERDL